MVAVLGGIVLVFFLSFYNLSANACECGCENSWIAPRVFFRRGGYHHPCVHLVGAYGSRCAGISAPWIPGSWWWSTAARTSTPDWRRDTPWSAAADWWSSASSWLTQAPTPACCRPAPPKYPPPSSPSSVWTALHSCPWVHFLWPNLLADWPNPTQPTTSRKICTQPLADLGFLEREGVTLETRASEASEHWWGLGLRENEIWAFVS